MQKITRSFAWEICALIWGLILFGVCTYIVFGLGQSKWWYAIAAFPLGVWSYIFLSKKET